MKQLILVSGIFVAICCQSASASVTVECKGRRGGPYSARADGNSIPHAAALAKISLVEKCRAAFLAAPKTLNNARASASCVNLKLLVNTVCEEVK